MTAKALVKEAAINRAIRMAKKNGAKRVHVRPDGSIDIILEDNDMASAPAWRHDDSSEPIVRIRPTKRVTL